MFFQKFRYFFIILYLYNEITTCAICINIYASSRYPVDVSDPKNILMLRVPAYKNSIILDLHALPDNKYYLVITALNRNNNESIPSNTTIFTIEPYINPVAIAKGQKE